MRVIGTAFDAAWDAIKHHFDDNPLSMEVARLRLANAILGVAREDGRDSEELKNLGLQAMALGYRLDPGQQVARQLRAAKYWRSHVEETLTVADQMNDPECKQMLMGIAETYAQLARHAEAREAREAARGASGTGRALRATSRDRR